MRAGAAWLGVLLLAGCTTTREVLRPASPEALRALTEETAGRPLRLGVSPTQDGMVLRYRVDAVPAEALQPAGSGVAWREPGSGAPRWAPVEALAWLRMPAQDPDRPRHLLLGAIAGGGAGLAVGLAVVLAFFTEPDTCVGGGAPAPGTGTFGRRCFPGWAWKLPVGGLVSLAAGAALGGLAGWLATPWEELQLVDHPPR